MTVRQSDVVVCFTLYPQDKIQDRKVVGKPDDKASVLALSAL